MRAAQRRGRGPSQKRWEPIACSRVLSFLEMKKGAKRAPEGDEKEKR